MKILLIIVSLALLIRLALVLPVYHGDMYNHIVWAKYALQYGLHNIYDVEFNLLTASKINQPPGTIFIFLLMRIAYKVAEKGIYILNNNLHLFSVDYLPFYLETKVYPAFLKLPAVAGDIGIGILIYKIASMYAKKKQALLASTFYLFNPITFYNSAWWGQTDATINFFGVLAFYFLLKKKLFGAITAIAISFFIKASLTVFLPIYIVMLFRQRYSITKIILYSLIVIATIFVITLPFHDISDPLWFFRIYINQVLFGTLGNLNENAFNIWALLFGIQPPHPAYTPVFGVPASFIGYILYFSSVALITARFIKSKFTIENALLSFILSAGSSYFFLTAIHERYLFPIFPMLALLLAFRSKLKSLYIEISAIHLVNLYYLWWVPEIPYMRMYLGNKGVINTLIVGLLVFFGLLAYFLLKWPKDLPQHEIEVN